MKRLIVPFLIAALAVLSHVASAQVLTAPGAPTVQAAPGGASVGAAVPFDLMPERTGVALPVSLAHVGGARVGDAGVGWNLATSTIVESTSVVRRLPRADGKVPLRVDVTIGGQVLDMIPTRADGTRHVARDRAVGAELVKETSSMWVLRRGEYEYAFAQLEHASTDTYYLIQIGHLPSDAHVDVDYEVRVGADDLVEVLLDRITYNFMPGEDGECAASRVDFLYALPDSLGLSATQGPLADSSFVLDVAAPTQPTQRAHARRQLLAEAQVRTQSGQCGGWRIASRVLMRYDVDPDTGLPRLRGVDRTGTDTSTALPVARYEYGRRGRLAGQIEYDADESRFAPAALPVGMPASFSDTQTFTLDPSYPPYGPDPAEPGDHALQAAFRPRRDITKARVTIERTYFAFADFTGDGLADLVYRGSSHGGLRLARNISDESGLKFADPVLLFAQGNFDVSTVSGSTRMPLGMRMTGYLSGNLVTTTWEFVRLMDFNGDGRLDVVDARAPDHWTVYLNTPATGAGLAHPEYAPAGDHPIYWMKTRVDIRDVRDRRRTEIESDGDPDTTDKGWIGGGYFPISWSISGARMGIAQAYVLAGDFIRCNPDLLPDDPQLRCAQDERNWRRRTDGDFSWGTAHSSTHVLQDVRDINGDGYPDLVASVIPADQEFLTSRFRNMQYGPIQYCNPGQPIGCPTQYETASGELPWLAAASYANPLSIITSYDHFYPQYLACLQNDRLDCEFTTDDSGASVEAAHRCYRWYGAASNCIVEDVSVYYRGVETGLPALPTFEIQVHYNIAGARLGPQSATGGVAFRKQPTLLANSAHCSGLDTYTVGDITSPTDPTYTAYLTCGVFDANSDGLADLTRAGEARLGTGAGFTAHAIESVLGGGVTYNRISCDAPGLAHPAYAHAPGDAPQPQAPTAITSPVGMDLDGDGFRDQRDQFGTGALRFGPDGGGWTQAHQAYDTYPVGSCAASPVRSKVLVDVTGDGRPDKVRIDGQQIKVSQPIVPAEGDRPADVGLLAAGRLVEVTDGYGAGVAYAYANAKLQPWGAHNVPSPEIVLASATPVARNVDGTRATQEPEHFAYGGIGLFFDSRRERFAATGYRFAVRMRGATLTTGGNAGKLKGSATVVMSRGLEAPAAKRVALLGTVDQSRTYEGYFESASDLLQQFMTADFEATTFYSGSTDNFTDAQTGASLGSPPSGDAGALCARLDFPYGGLGAPTAPSGDAADFCTRQYTRVPRTETSWSGALFAAADVMDVDIDGHDALLRRYVRTRRVVETWDDRGRPLTVRDERDTTTPNDDVCHRFEYARPGGLWADKEFAPQDAIGLHAESDCAGSVIRTSRYTYSGESTPGAFVAAPRVAQVHTSYASNGGVATHAGALRKYNAYGQVHTLVETNDSPLANVGVVTRTTTLRYDPFSLVVEGSSTVASDVPDYTREQAFEHHPVTYAPTAVTDMNTGVRREVQHDGFARPLTETIRAGGTSQLLSRIDYVGDDAAQHAGRRIRTTRYPFADGSGAQVTELRLDGFGRPVRRDASTRGITEWLGGYDRLGRLQFEYAPHATGAHQGEPVTTHLHPLLSSEPQCAVQAPEVRKNPERVTKRFGREAINGLFGREFSLPVTRGELDQVATCTIAGYSEGRRTTFTTDPLGHWGVAEHTPGRAEVFDAVGRRLEQRMWDRLSSSPVQQMRWRYDRYGVLDRLSRYRKPHLTAPTEAVHWYYETDGLGRVRTFRRNAESALPLALDPVRYEYDDWNQVVRVDTGRSATEAGMLSNDVGHLYDGFGRLTRMRSLAPIDEEGNTAPVNAPAWRPDGLEVRHSYRARHEAGAGQLAMSVRSRRVYSSVEHVYDAMGRLQALRHSDGQLTAERAFTYRGLGVVESQTSRLLQDSGPAETLRYGYDGLGDLARVAYSHGGVETVVEETLTRDLFGRPLQVRMGNGTQRTYDYAPTGRRELRSIRDSLPGLPVSKGVARLTTFADVDVLGRATTVLSELKDAAGATRDGVKQRYHFGDLNVLAGFDQYELPSGTRVRGESYRYDPLGNLAFVLDAFGADRAYVPLATDRDRLCAVETGDYLGIEAVAARDTQCSVSYDKRGNVVQYRDPTTTQVRSLLYDGFNDIETVYHGGGQIGLVRGTGGDIVMHYVGSQALRRIGSYAERFSDGPAIWENGLLPGVSRRGAAGAASLYYAGADTNAAQTTADGIASEVARRAFSPYGMTTEVDEPSRKAASASRWHGLDACAGANGAQGCNIGRLYVMGPRAYDASLGRFLQRDPLVIPRTAAAVNPYQYAWQNPIVFHDRSGLDPAQLTTITETIDYYNQGSYESIGFSLFAHAVTERLFDVLGKQKDEWKPNWTQDGMQIVQLSLFGPGDNAMGDSRSGHLTQLAEQKNLQVTYFNVGYSANAGGGELGVSFMDMKLKAFELKEPIKYGPMGLFVIPEATGELYFTGLGVEYSPGEKANARALTAGYSVTSKWGPLTATVGQGVGLDPFRYDVKCDGNGRECIAAGGALAVHTIGSTSPYAKIGHVIWNKRQADNAAEARRQEGRDTMANSLAKSLDRALYTPQATIPRVVCTSEPDGALCY